MLIIFTSFKIYLISTDIRAERRKAYYDAIKDDPVSYLRIHGNSFRIHLDPKVNDAAGSAMMEWNGSGKGSDDGEKQVSVVTSFFFE